MNNGVVTYQPPAGGPPPFNGDWVLGGSGASSPFAAWNIGVPQGIGGGNIVPRQGFNVFIDLYLRPTVVNAPYTANQYTLDFLLGAYNPTIAAGVTLAVGVVQVFSLQLNPTLFTQFNYTLRLTGTSGTFPVPAGNVSVTEIAYIRYVPA